MKKMFLFVIALALVFSFSACGSSGTATGEEAKQIIDSIIQDAENTVAGNLPADAADEIRADVSAANEPEIMEQEITEPELDWFMIDDFETGIPRLVLAFMNPNSFPIDFEISVTYLKGGENQGISEGLYKNCVPAGERCIIWHNWEIPEADDLEVNFTYLAESVYFPVNCTYQELARTNESVTLKFVTQSSFSQCVVDVVGTLNGNRTSHLFYDFYDMDSNEFCFEGWRAFDSYEVYINCY